MAKKKSQPTFRDLLDNASDRLAERKSDVEETKFYSQLIWEGFCAAFRIGMARSYYPDFASDLALVMISPGYAAVASETTFWPNWPRQPFVQLGFYNFPNRSALEVATQFSECICQIAQDVSCTTFAEFEFDKFKTPEMKRWSTALINEFHRQPANWPANVSQEDFNRLHRQVNDELARFESADRQYAVTLPLLPPSRFKPTGKSITVATVCRLLKGMEAPDGRKIPCSRRTVDAWKLQWAIVKTTDKTIYYSWDDARNHIDLMFQYDIGEPGDNKAV